MAITILKNTPTHCVVKVYGANASETIGLATTLLRTNQVADTPVVDIRAIHWSVPGATPATITRNSVLHWNLTAAYSLLFNGFSDNVNNTSDIVVAIPAGGGSVILELVKISGYGDNQHANQNYDDMAITPTTTTTAAPTTTTTAAPTTTTTTAGP